ncbi:hypothetical protein ACFY9N_11825 [Microbacterium sp. NPDC008134]|uniref:hypothetical protein n=1 Tax=Microbacterium sp. NPDC008134 TaxID=3364183 RepID=UPI0036E97F55
MTTWNVITIENPGALTVAALPEALTSEGEIWEGYSADDTRDAVEPREIAPDLVAPGRAGDPNGCIIIEGHSKWEAEEAIAALVQLTRDAPEMKVTHFQEWDYDGVGSESAVYRGGEIVRAESKVSQLVPVDLDKLAETLREALGKRGYDRNTMPAVRAAAQALVDALA